MDTASTVPRAAILNIWSEQEWINGVQLDELREIEWLAVRTANSIYEITVLDGRRGDVLVRGGQYFAELTPVRFTGSTLGGAFLKERGIYVGMKMEMVPQPVEIVPEVFRDPTTGQKELRLAHRVITTSAVQSIGVAR